MSGSLFACRLTRLYPALFSAAGPLLSDGVAPGHSPAGCPPGLSLACRLPIAFGAGSLAALLATELYARNEPLALLLLPGRPAARLLGGKLLTAWRNLFLGSLPAAVLTLVLYPASAWMAAVWIPYAALAMTYAVLAKYAAYDPRTPDAAPSTAARIGLLGLLLPPLLPVTLLLTIGYAVRAERNLDRYLHDYD